MSGGGSGGGRGAAARGDVIFRGQRLGRVELHKIAGVIRRHRRWTCEEIARSVCRSFGWRQGNGQLAARACRNMLKRLEREGRWQLPVPRRVGNGGRARRTHHAPEATERPAITERVGAVTLRLLDKPERAAWQAKLAAFHYLGGATVVGESLWYEAALGDEPVAVLVWGGGRVAQRAARPVRGLGCRHAHRSAVAGRQ